MRQCQEQVAGQFALWQALRFHPGLFFSLLRFCFRNQVFTELFFAFSLDGEQFAQKESCLPNARRWNDYITLHVNCIE